LIKQDLRELGIKIPKGKKLKKQAQYTKNQQSQQVNNFIGIHGYDLP
jgi:hypothetical protein